MSTEALNQLTIEHLRGSVISFTLPFEKDKKLSVIYGENGAGKSTICDAFDFIGNGKVGSLENRGLITMRRMEDREFPDRMKAMFSIKNEKEKTNGTSTSEVHC